MYNFFTKANVSSENVSFAFPLSRKIIMNTCITRMYIHDKYRGSSYLCTKYPLIITYSVPLYSINNKLNRNP